MSALAHVEFHGDTLWAMREDDGQVLVALKPICQGMGVSWQSQHERLKADPVLADGIRLVLIPSPRGVAQETVCLPLELVNGWLFKIDARRVKDPEARNKVIAYQRECYAVLFAHFHGKAVEAAQGKQANDGAEPLSDAAEERPDLELWRLWLVMIGQARKLFGANAARALWALSPLPQVNLVDGEMADPLDLASEVGAFVRANLVEDPAARTPTGAVLRLWNRANPRRPMTAQAFGRLLKDAGFQSAPARQGGAIARCLFGWRWGWGDG